MKTKILGVIVTVLLCGVPQQLSAAIAFDTATTDNTNFPTAPTLSFSHTITGSDRLLIVAVRSIVLTSLSATTNGATMTAAVSMTPVEGGRFTFFYKLNADVGVNAVVITGGVTSLMYASSSSYTGVLQFDVAGTPMDCSTMTECGMSLVTTKNNTWTIGAFWQAGGMNVGSGAGTERTDIGASVMIIDTNANKPTPGSTFLDAVSFTCDPTPEFFGEGASFSSDTSPVPTVNSGIFLVLQ